MCLTHCVPRPLWEPSMHQGLGEQGNRSQKDNQVRRALSPQDSQGWAETSSASTLLPSTLYWLSEPLATPGKGLSLPGAPPIGQPPASFHLICTRPWGVCMR